MATPDTEALTEAEMRDLRRLAGFMIPADMALGLPGADDPAILGDIAASLGRDAPAVKAALGALAAETGDGFAGMDEAAAEALAMRFLDGSGPGIAALGRVVLAAYYRDDRVVRSLGRQPGPSFPRGHVMPPTDWSLLDPVKAREPFWRDDRRA